MFYHVSPADLKVGDKLKLTKRDRKTNRPYACLSTTIEQAKYWINVLKSRNNGAAKIYAVEVPDNDIVYDGMDYNEDGTQKHGYYLFETGIRADMTKKARDVKEHIADMDTEVCVFAEYFIVKEVIKA